MIEIPIGVIVCWSFLMAFFVMSACLLLALRISERQEDK